MRTKDINEQIDKLEMERKNAITLDTLEEAAEYTYNIYQSFLNAGFDETQAWELTTIQFTNACKR